MRGFGYGADGAVRGKAPIPPVDEMGLIKPRRIEPGDRIAVVSPSWGGGGLFPGLLDLGIAGLRRTLDAEVVEFPTARADADYLYEHPEERARDINDAFGDPSIRGIIAVIGGSDSIRILEDLETGVILENPKIIMGYSDTTAILAYLNTLGLETFYGPSVLSGWAQMDNFPYLAGYYRRAFMENSGEGEVEPFADWSNGYPDWKDAAGHGRVLDKRPNREGHVYLQGRGVHRGRLWGGCLGTLEMLNGTRYWPVGDFWNDKILFFETSETKPTPSHVMMRLRNFGIQGILNRIRGIFVGRPKDYDDDEKGELYEGMVRIVSGEFGAGEIPIVANMSFGHTDPNMVLPYGVLHEVDCSAESIRRLECVYS